MAGPVAAWDAKHTRNHLASNWARSGPNAGPAAGLLYVGDAIREQGTDIVSAIEDLTDAVKTVGVDFEAQLNAVHSELVEVRRAAEEFGS
jgi:hypothetical protein